MVLHHFVAHEPAAKSPDAEYTIDELARVTGLTVRNIRAHQSRGLLPPPAVRGRTGYYGTEHAARLRLIVEMQADGFNLNSIKRLLGNLPPGSASRVLHFEEMLREPWTEEEPEVMDAAELAQRFSGGKPDAEVEKRATRLGLIRPLGEGRYEVPFPSLLRAGEALREIGIRGESMLDVVAQLNAASEKVAAAFIRLFVDEVWKPFDLAGRPEDQWPRVQQQLERMRPLALESLRATFQRVMGEAVADSMSRIVLQEPKRRPRPTRRAPQPAARNGRRRSRAVPASG